MQNFYSGYGRIVYGDRLVGREADVALLVERLRQGNNQGIVGQRRIGKTSLLVEVTRQLRQTRYPDPIVWLDVSTFSSDAEMFKEVLDEVVDAYVGLGKELPTRFEERILSLPVESAYDAYKRCRRGLTSLSQA